LITDEVAWDVLPPGQLALKEFLARLSS